MEPRVRVLCLHGYRTNAAVMQNQTAGLRAAFGDQAEFIFLNGPREAAGPSDDTIERLHAKDKPFYEWVAAGKASPSDEHFDELAWTWKFQFYEQCDDYIEDQLSRIGRVDVVVGFSQGAILASTLTMLYAHRYNNPTRWWDMCVCVGGSSVRAVNCRTWFETPDGRNIRIPIPSIHVIGKKDFFYSAGLRLVEQYDSFSTSASKTLTKAAFIHEGGHKFPTAAKNPGLYEDIVRLVVGHIRERRLLKSEAEVFETPSDLASRL